MHRLASRRAIKLSTNGYVASTTATRPYFHYYLGDANGQDIDYAPSRAEPGTYDFIWYNAQTKQWVTDRATFGSAGSPKPVPAKTATQS